MDKKPIAAGTSSFDLIDRPAFLEVLKLRECLTVLDLACGRGNYSLELARHVGDRGTIYAVDLWEEGVRSLEEEIARRGIATIKPIRADVSKRIPLEAQSVDLCLMATVLHDLIQDGTAEGSLAEVRRVLKRGGRLAIIEFKVVDGPPGPPKSIRIDPETTSRIVRPFGFSLDFTRDLGPFTYLSQFSDG